VIEDNWLSRLTQEGMTTRSSTMNVQDMTTTRSPMLLVRPSLNPLDLLGLLVS
jgi:hypothetical protein